MNTSQSIVSANWLYEHLDDPLVAIADCRFSLKDPELGKQQYNQSHIPGANFFDLNRDLSRPVAQHGGRHPLPDPEQLSEKLSAMGVTAQTLVVAYDDTNFAFAARLWWLLRYLGHERVAVLDGGFASWLAAGYPVTAIAPPPQTGKFVPQVQSAQVVDIAAVKTRKDLPGVVLVDSRERDRFLGIREPIDKVAGHIPGAVNYPWQEVTDAQGYLRSSKALRHYWQELEPATEIIVYCGSGVTACVNLLALELAGIPSGKLYAGSWSDWCSFK